MPGGLLGQADLQPQAVQRVLKTIIGGYPRVLAAHPEEVVKRGLEVKAAMDADDKEIEPALKDLLVLDPEWRELGVELGIVAPEGPAPQAVCGGLCIFGAGVAAGIIIEKVS